MNALAQSYRSCNRNQQRAVLLVLALSVAGLIFYGTGGYGAISRTLDQSTSLTTANTQINIETSMLPTDPLVDVHDEVFNMVPGDVRERLVRLTNPTPASLSNLTYAVQAELMGVDPTVTPLVGVNQLGDATNMIDATNAGATAGDAGTAPSAGNGGLAIEIYQCPGSGLGAWSVVAGVVASRVDDRDYTCVSSGGNGLLVGSLIDVPSTGFSTPMALAPIAIENASATPQPFLLRIRFLNDGTTDGRQNIAMGERVSLTHRFVAEPDQIGPQP